MDHKLFSGVGSALITPFSDGSIDYGAFGNLIESQISAGIPAIVVSGTTGESPTLSHSEKYALFGAAVERSGKRIRVVAGTGSNDTATAVKLSRLALLSGCDALLVVTPYYNKATSAGLYEHYSRIAEVGLPVIAYNVPSRTGLNMPIDVISRLYESGAVSGLKEASGDLVYTAKIIRNCPGLAVYSGNDDRILPVLSLGGRGVISVASNAYPYSVKGLCDAFAAGRLAEAAKAQSDLLRLNDLLFEEVNPVPIKYLLHVMGLCRDEYRLPLTPPSDPLKEKIRRFVESIGI